MTENGFAVHTIWVPASWPGRRSCFPMSFRVGSRNPVVQGRQASASDSTGKGAEGMFDQASALTHPLGSFPRWSVGTPLWPLQRPRSRIGTRLHDAGAWEPENSFQGFGHATTVCEPQRLVRIHQAQRAHRRGEAAYPTTVSGTGPPSMRFAPLGSAILKDLPRSPHPTSFVQPTWPGQWTDARTSPAYEQRGPTRSCFREDLYALALHRRSESLCVTKASATIRG